MRQLYRPSESGPNPAPRAEDEWDADVVERDGRIVGAWHVTDVGEGRDEVTFAASVTAEVALRAADGGFVGMRIVRRMPVGRIREVVADCVARPPRTFKTSRDVHLKDFGRVTCGMARLVSGCDAPSSRPPHEAGPRNEIHRRLLDGEEARSPDPETRKAAAAAAARDASARADACMRRLADAVTPYLETLDQAAVATVGAHGGGITNGCWEGLDANLPAAGALRNDMEARPAFPALLCAAWRRDPSDYLARRGDLDRLVSDLLQGQPHALPRWLAAAHADASDAYRRLGAEKGMLRLGTVSEDLLGEAMGMLAALPPDWLPKGPDWDMALSEKNLLHRTSGHVAPDDLAGFLNVGGRWRDWAARLRASGGRTASGTVGRLFDDAFDVTRALASEVLSPASTANSTPIRVPHHLGPVLLWSGWTLRRVVEHSARWHARRPAALAAIAALPSSVDRPKEWGAGVPDWSDGNLSIKVLTSPEELLAEGADGIDVHGMAGLSHCVGGYASRCRSGRCRILSVTGPAPDGGRERLSTVELAWRREAWNVLQHCGRRNAEPATEARSTVERYVALLSNGKLPVDRKALEPMVEDDAATRAAGYDVNHPGNVEAVLRIWDRLLPRGMRGRSPADWADLTRAHAGGGPLLRRAPVRLPDGTVGTP